MYELYKDAKKLAASINAQKQYDKTRFLSAKAQREWECDQKLLKRLWDDYEESERQRKMWNNESSHT
jgi:hypothetical protein